MNVKTVEGRGRCARAGTRRLADGSQSDNLEEFVNRQFIITSLTDTADEGFNVFDSIYEYLHFNGNLY